MGVNCPSIESTDLTTVRKFVPHATSPNIEKAGSVGDQGKTRGKEEGELWKNTE
jgi:hypothetical protein